MQPAALQLWHGPRTVASDIVDDEHADERCLSELCYTRSYLLLEIKRVHSANDAVTYPRAGWNGSLEPGLLFPCGRLMQSRGNPICQRCSTPKNWPPDLVEAADPRRYAGTYIHARMGNWRLRHTNFPPICSRLANHHKTPRLTQPSACQWQSVHQLI